MKADSPGSPNSCSHPDIFYWRDIDLSRVLQDLSAGFAPAAKRARFWVDDGLQHLQKPVSPDCFLPSNDIKMHSRKSLRSSFSVCMDCAAMLSFKIYLKTFFLSGAKSKSRLRNTYDHLNFPMSQRLCQKFSMFLFSELPHGGLTMLMTEL